MIRNADIAAPADASQPAPGDDAERAGGRARLNRIASEPVPVPEAGIARAVEILRSGRLFRYGEDTSGEDAEVSKLEAEFAAAQNRRYAAAVNSCGSALFLALRAVGVEHGDEILCNAFTLAPVPGAVVHAGARARFVEMREDLTVDTDDLARQAAIGRPKAFLLSHMRGHFGDIAEIAEICRRHDIALIEDCAHTLGADWDGRLVGSYGDVACFSSQTFKHLNSGEGGILTTDRPEIAARVVIMSGSYMFYGQNGARPDDAVFEEIRDQLPCFSMRMSNLVAALLRPQLAELAGWRARWNERYRWLESALAGTDHVALIERGTAEGFVGSSIQFRLTGLTPAQIAKCVAVAGEHGVFLKWFGADRTVGFTSRYDQWGYLDGGRDLPVTDRVLAALVDMRIPLTLTEAECQTIGQVIAEAIADAVAGDGA